MSALAPVDAASCRAMAVECGRRAGQLQRMHDFRGAQRQITRARELCLLALKFEQEASSQNAAVNGGQVPTDDAVPFGDESTAIEHPCLPSGAAACAADTSVVTLLPATEDKTEEQNSLSTPTPLQTATTAGAGATAPAVPIESDGPKSRPGDAAASHTQQSSSPRQERPSAKERSSDRSGGQFGDAPKPAHIPFAEVQP